MYIDFKNTYQYSLVCPILITSADGKILCKNIAAEKIIPFVRKGANILRYINEEPCFHLTYPENDMLIIKIMASAEYTSVHKALVIPYKPADGGEELSLLLFKATSLMLAQESPFIKSSLLSRSIPLLNDVIRGIMDNSHTASTSQTSRFVRNNCTRIYQMDRILSEFYQQRYTNKLRVRGIYEVRAMLRELREYMSDYSTYLGYRITFTMEDNPFLIYAEPQHFYAMLIFVYSLIYRYSADGKLNICYTYAVGRSCCFIRASTAFDVGSEHNRFDHTLMDIDLCLASFFAELCGCCVINRIENSLFELEIQIFQSEKIKGLLRSNPDMLYHCSHKASDDIVT